MIVQALREIQDRHGFLPREELERLSVRISTPLYRLQEVASFFPHFRMTPPPKYTVLVCRDMACALRGSREILKNMQRKAESRPAGEMEVCGTSCLGRCDRAPAVRVAAEELKEAPKEDLGGSISLISMANFETSHGHFGEANYLGWTADELLELVDNMGRKKLPPGDTDWDYPPHGIRETQWQIDPYGRGRQKWDSIRKLLREYGEATKLEKEPPGESGTPREDADFARERVGDEVMKAMDGAVRAMPVRDSDEGRRLLVAAIEGGVATALAKPAKAKSDKEEYSEEVKKRVIDGIKDVLSTAMPRDTDEILRMMAPDIWKVVVTGLPQEPDDSRRKLFDGAMNALKTSAKSDEGVKLRRKGRDLRRLLSGAVRDGLKAALAGRPGDVADKLSKEVAKAIETAVPKEPDMVRDVLGSDVRASIRLQLPKGPAETRQRASVEVLKALETANLLGMGGAGGRSWMKWSDVQAAEGTIKYVVCNGDESEPGTFKDRELLLRAPHLVIEGMMIGGFVTGASKGYVYIRHEYDEQIAAVRKAIQDARAAGVLGEHLYGTDFSFDLEAFVSPGGYICGEQSALIEAMEDKRAEPRNRPPELQTNGLWDKPTLLNNVETFAWVPAILVKDFGKWYADSGVKAGAAKCKGRRLFSLSGDVVKPGVYEVANGTPLRDLIKMAGGMVGGKALKAFAPSGPSCGFIPGKIPLSLLPPKFVESLKPAPADGFYDLMDMPLDFGIVRNDLRLMLGAGLTAYAEGSDMFAAAQAAGEFFRNESCGKCVPCRLGSQKIVQLGEKVRAGGINRADFQKVLPAYTDLVATMEKASICGLGQVAANPFATLVKYFPEDLDAAFGKGKR
jgi:NADH:ubiquinone oxidoreductase subunit F (NADH-binding)/NADH:ubiquinone oxidoreductase subunit E